VSHPKKFLQATGRRSDHGYVNFPRSVHDRLRQVSPHALKAFCDLYFQYNGKNNGDFALPWRKASEWG